MKYESQDYIRGLNDGKSQAQAEIEDLKSRLRKYEKPEIFEYEPKPKSFDGYIYQGPPLKQSW